LHCVLFYQPNLNRDFAGGAEAEVGEVQRWEFEMSGEKAIFVFALGRQIDNFRVGGETGLEGKIGLLLRL